MKSEKLIHNGIGPAYLQETWTGPGPYLDLSSSGPTLYRVSGPHRTSSRRSLVKARPIWTQSGTGPKFIRSRVNGALNSHTKKLYIRSALNSRIWERQLQKEKRKNSDCRGRGFQVKTISNHLYSLFILVMSILLQRYNSTLQ